MTVKSVCVYCRKSFDCEASCKFNKKVVDKLDRRCCVCYRCFNSFIKCAFNTASVSMLTIDNWLSCDLLLSSDKELLMQYRTLKMLTDER